MEMLAHKQNWNKLPQPRVPVLAETLLSTAPSFTLLKIWLNPEHLPVLIDLITLSSWPQGDVKELVRSCHHLPAEESYDEDRWLLRRKYGDDYRIASAYEMKALDSPSIKAEDGMALNRSSVFLASCKKALAGSQYISKFDQPGNIEKLVLKLPYSLRERWRYLADDIMDRQLRPVQFSDFVAFVDREAKILTNPVFGKISYTIKIDTWSSVLWWQDIQFQESQSLSTCKR